MKSRSCCSLRVKTVLLAIKSSFRFDKNVRKKRRGNQKLFKINLDCNVHQVKAHQEGEIENEKGKEEKALFSKFSKLFLSVTKTCLHWKGVRKKEPVVSLLGGNFPSNHRAGRKLHSSLSWASSSHILLAQGQFLLVC